MIRLERHKDQLILTVIEQRTVAEYKLSQEGLSQLIDDLEVYKTYWNDPRYEQ